MFLSFLRTPIPSAVRDTHSNCLSSVFSAASMIPDFWTEQQCIHQNYHCFAIQLTREEEKRQEKPYRWKVVHSWPFYESSTADVKQNLILELSFQKLEIYFLPE